MKYLDQNNLTVSASSLASINIFNVFCDLLLSSSNRTYKCIKNLIKIDSHFPLAEIYTALLFISTARKSEIVKAKVYIDRAMSLYPTATAREKKIIKSTQLWYLNDKNSAILILDEVLDEYTGDIITAKWAQLLHFEMGNSKGILNSPLKVAKNFKNNAHLHAMLAFGYEECNLIHQAKSSVNKALHLNPLEPWAHHAMAHICYTENNLDFGISFMFKVSKEWQDLDLFMLSHNWWHTCLFLIDKGRENEVLDLFDKYIWKDKYCIYTQVNAISLLYRLERLNVDVGKRWEDINKFTILNAEDQLSLFLDFHILYALYRSQNSYADDMSERMKDKSKILNNKYLVKYLVSAIKNITLRFYQKALVDLEKILPKFEEIGGSNAQKDLLDLFYIDALKGAKNWRKTQQVLLNRSKTQPNTIWIQKYIQESYFEDSLAN